MAVRLALAAAALAVAPAARADPEGLRALQKLDQLVTDIGYRIARSGGPLCRGEVPLAGFAVHDLSQYFGGQQADARATFGFEDAPMMLAVAAGSPAAAAGITDEDAILAIDGAPPPPLPAKAVGGYARTAALLDQVEAAAADGTIDLELRRKGETRTVRLTLERGCATRFQTDVSDQVGAKADGRYVSVNTGTMTFAASEAELAAVMAHEISHNILQHRARLNAVGISRGLFGQFGRSARRMRQTEEEADRLSVYLMDRAGYPPEAIASFWTRFHKANVLLDIFGAPTHLSGEKRIALVHAEIVRIAAMKAAGKLPQPAFMEDATLPDIK